VYGEYFEDFCRKVFSYQYVKHRTEITPGIIDWLYEHSTGITSVVVSLIHDAQEIAILDGREVLNIETLNEAYTKRLEMMHAYVSIKQKRYDTVKKKVVKKEQITTDTDCVISESIKESKILNTDFFEVLKRKITVEEISIC